MVYRAWLFPCIGYIHFQNLLFNAALISAKVIGGTPTTRSTTPPQQRITWAIWLLMSLAYVTFTGSAGTF